MEGRGCRDKKGAIKKKSTALGAGSLLLLKEYGYNNIFEFFFETKHSKQMEDVNEEFFIPERTPNH